MSKPPKPPKPATQPALSPELAAPGRIEEVSDALLILYDVRDQRLSLQRREKDQEKACLELFHKYKLTNYSDGDANIKDAELVAKDPREGIRVKLGTPTEEVAHEERENKPLGKDVMSPPTAGDDDAGDPQ